MKALLIVCVTSLALCLLGCVSTAQHRAQEEAIVKQHGTQEEALAKMNAEREQARQRRDSHLAAQKKAIIERWSEINNGMTFEQIDKILHLTSEDDDIMDRLRRESFSTNQPGRGTFFNDFCTLTFESGRLVDKILKSTVK